MNCKICPLHICLPPILTTALREKHLPCFRPSYKQSFNHTFPFIFLGRKVRIFVFSIPCLAGFRKISALTYTVKAVFLPLTSVKRFPLYRRFLRILWALSRTTLPIPSFILSFIKKRANLLFGTHALKTLLTVISKQKLQTIYPSISEPNSPPKRRRIYVYSTRQSRREWGFRHSIKRRFIAQYVYSTHTCPRLQSFFP